MQPFPPLRIGLAGPALRYILAAKLKRMRRLDVGGTRDRLCRCRVIRGC
jgi:hypothetical protein